jgi:hypothetical protein
MGRPGKARLFAASPSPSHSHHTTPVIQLPAHSLGIRVHAALAPRCHPPTLPVSLCLLRQRLRSRSACSPRHRPGAPSPSSPDHRAGSRTPPHTLRASSCCARATGPQSAVPILPGWCAWPTERGARAPKLRPGVASACLAWPPSQRPPARRSPALCAPGRWARLPVGAPLRSLPSWLLPTWKFWVWRRPALLLAAGGRGRRSRLLLLFRAKGSRKTARVKSAGSLRLLRVTCALGGAGNRLLMQINDEGAPGGRGRSRQAEGRGGGGAWAGRGAALQVVTWLLVRLHPASGFSPLWAGWVDVVSILPVCKTLNTALPAAPSARPGQSPVRVWVSAGLGKTRLPPKQSEKWKPWGGHFGSSPGAECYKNWERNSR